MSGTDERMRVLHVDDDPATLDRVAEFLERRGDGTEVASRATVDGGLDRLEAGTVDCVVVGCGPTPSDELAPLEAVRERRPDLPVVVVCARVTPAEAIDAGASDWVANVDDRDGLVLLANRVTNAAARRRAERALEDDQQRRGSGPDRAAGALCVIDEAGRFTRINRQWRSQLGFPSEDLVGEPAIEYVHPDDRNPVTAAYRRALEAPDEPVTAEFRVETADGGWLWIDTQFRQLDGATGELGRVALEQTTFGREEGHRELELFRQLLDHSSDEIYVIDPATGRFVDANGTACERLGYSREELSELRVVDVAAGIEADEWPEHAETVREEGGVVFLANHVRSDGSTYPVEVNVVHVESVGAEYMVSINRDMSDRHAQERQLLRYRAIVESMDDAVFMIAPDGTYAYVNEAAAANTGRSREAIVGMHFADVLESGLLADDEQLDDLVALVEAILEGERSTGRRVVEIATPNGDRRVLDTELIEVTSSQQGRIGVAGVTRDITERVDYQEELERQNERLEEFAGVLSHDLRNPLNVAEARVELARSERDSDHLEEASAAHGRMRTLIDDLLTMARNGGSVDRTEPVRLGDAVVKCWAMVETGDATVSADDDVVVEAHRSRLEQLLENLLRNAVEHGGASVAVSVGSIEDGFYVADDGPGIPGGERADVFDSGYSTAEDGTGLGLAIVEQIAAAHGWSVRAAESAAGGARFEFTGVETADP